MADSKVRRVPQYVYRPLSQLRQEFRLLSLLPAPHKKADVSCSLNIYSLSRQPPEYEALSYTWGEDNKYDRVILVDGCIFMITSKLWTVLLNLRDATLCRDLWIDAICIDTENIDDRVFHIGATRHIIAQARRIVVWLDEPTVALPVLEDAIVRSSVRRGRNAERVQDVLGTYDLLEAFCGIFSHPWFCRVWTIQEYALARSAVFVWGDRSIGGADVVHCVAELWRALAEGDYASIVTPEALEQLREELSGLIYFDWVRRKIADGELDELEFMRMLVASEGLYTKDPRDNIFALMSLAPPALLEDFNPDYSLTPEEVYRALGEAMSLAARVDAVFRSIETSYLANQVTSMPDWMPGWIEDLSLRVSGLPGNQSATAKSTQKAVFECMEVLTSHQREAQGYLNLSRTEKNKLAKSLRDAHNILAYFLGESESTVLPPPLTPEPDRLSSISQGPYRPLSLDPDVKSSTSIEADDTHVKVLHSVEADGTSATVLHPVQDDFSDSGYSSASSSAQNTILVASEIADTLLAHEYFRRLLSAAGKLEYRDDVFAHHLRPCIRQLGNLLDPMASDSEELLAARELKRHAHFIARAIVSRTRQHNFEEDQAVKERRRDRIVRFLDERGLKPSSRLHDTVDHVQQLPPEGADHSAISESSFDDGELPKTALDKVKEFMTTEIAFLPFLHLTSRIVYESPIENIEAEIRACIPESEDHTKNIIVEFSMPGNIVTLFTEEDASASADLCYTQFLRSLVISGTVRSCYATNCESYLRWRWPGTSESLLQNLEVYIEAILSRDTTSVARDGSTSVACDGSCVTSFQQGHHDVPGWIRSELHPAHRSKGSEFKILVHGTIHSVRDISQQLAWLTAACRQSEARRPSLSEVIFFGTDVGNPSTFKIVTLPLKQVNEQDACWVPLLPGTIIARGWPVPKRGSENGLELPFNLMLSLIGPLYPMIFGRRFCLKAYSRILFPVSATSSVGEPLCVQWHYDSKRDTMAKPPWHGNQHESLDHIETYDTQKLVDARTFLGYCRKAVVDLGTARAVDEHKSILYSGLENESHATGMGLPTALTMGTGGLLPITLTANFPIIQQKAQLLAEDLDRDYMDVVYEAQERPVILYDTNGSARGWMVPLSCVLLHMVHTWLAKHGIITSDHPYTNLACQSGVAARKVLLDSWNFVVRKTISEDLQKDTLFRDKVMQFWKDICQKQFQDLLATTQADYNFQFQTEKLYGWEYMDVVDRKYSRRKQLDFKTNWGSFREQCIVLFAKNLGHVIQPAPDAHVCEKWNPDKRKRMHLTATIECLTTLAYHNGGERENLTTFRLTNKGYWHYRPKELFVDCEGCGQRACVKRPQYLRPTPPQDTSLVPPSEGAVVFGRNLLRKTQPLAQGGAPARSDKERHRGSKFLSRAKLSVRNHLERMVSGSAREASSQGPSDTPLLSEESGDDEEQ